MASVSQYDMSLVTNVWLNEGAALYRFKRFEEVVKVCSRILIVEKDSIDALMLMGRAYRSLHKNDQAWDCFSRVTLINPAYAPAMTANTVLLCRSKKFQEAIEHCTSAIRAIPDNPDLWNDLGFVYIHKGDVHAALVHLDKALALDPDHVGALMNKGSALYSMQEFGRALVCFRDIIVIDNKNPFAWNSAGTCHIRLGRSDIAHDYFDRAIALDPTFVKAWFNRGMLLFNEKQYLDARCCFLRVLELQPVHVVARSRLVDCFVALKQFADVILWCPETDKRLVYAKGELLLQKNQLDGARGYFTESQAIDDRYAPSWDGLGRTLLLLKNFPAALAAFDRAIAISPTVGDTFCNRGVVLTHMGDLQGAISSFYTAHVHLPKSASVLAEIGRLYMKLRNPSRAKDFFYSAYQLDSNDPRILSNYAYSLEATGDLSEAMYLLHRFLHDDETKSTVWYTLGALYAKDGNISNAREAFAMYDLYKRHPRSIAPFPTLFQNKSEFDDVLDPPCSFESAFQSLENADVLYTWETLLEDLCR